MKLLFKILVGAIFAVFAIGVTMAPSTEETEARLVAEVASVPASNTDENIRLYEKLADLRPENERYKSKLAHYNGIKKIEKAREDIGSDSLEVRAGGYKVLMAAFPDDAVIQENGASMVAAWQRRLDVLERRERIEKAFSKWDGSHRNLVEYVKGTMHNPDSFEHVDTKYTDRGDHLYLVMTFRGTNGFGATVTNTVRANATIGGRVSEILSSE